MAYGVSLMAAANLVLCVAPMYVVFKSDSYVMFLELFLPHAVIGKIAWYTNIPWARRQVARLLPWGKAVAPAPGDASARAVLAGHLKTVQVIAREQVRCSRRLSFLPSWARV